MLRLFYVIIFLTVGCHTKIHDKGLLTLQGKKIKLSNIDGKTYHVHAGKDKVYLQQLQGCIVYVEGSRLWEHIFVDDWTIQDAGSGSAPFLGRLKREGIQWSILDHNSKSVVFFEGLTEFIQPAEGDIVLIGGYIIGKQRVQVISAKILLSED